MPRSARRWDVQAAPTPRPAQYLDAYTRVSKSQGPQRRPARSKTLVTPADAGLDHKRKAPCPVLLPSGPEDEELEATPEAKRARLRLEVQLRSSAQNKALPKDKRVAKSALSHVETGHSPIQSTIIHESGRQAKATPARISGAAVPPNKSSRPASNHSDQLPPHLFDLVRLHRAFLRTVAVQIAHMGDNVPIDICTMTPNISRTWGKRQVTADDIRRCLAIQAYSPAGGAATPSPFIMSDYGRGKICIELARGCRCIDEEGLDRQFQRNLGAFCAQRTMDEMKDMGVSLERLSMAELPQAAVSDRGAGTEANPILAKGHRALSNLKSDIKAKKQDKMAREQALVGRGLLNPSGNKISLLDRIRLKQLAKDNETLPPTGPELQRRAALHRVVDVTAIISMLSLSTPLALPRQAFTMAAISTRLMDSLQVPISKEEGMACLRLMATEVTPEWLKLVKIGGQELVVIQRSGQLVDRVIQGRVQELLAA